MHEFIFEGVGVGAYFSKRITKAGKGAFEICVFINHATFIDVTSKLKVMEEALFTKSGSSLRLCLAAH